MDDSDVGLFQDASLRVIGHIRDPGKSEFFIFWRAGAWMFWMYRKQSAVSHRSAEAEVLDVNVTSAAFTPSES